MEIRQLKQKFIYKAKEFKEILDFKKFLKTFMVFLKIFLN